MRYVPREYQKRIVDAIVNNERTAIYAGMGMGKTSATLEALRRLKESDDCFPVLIVAPLRVAQSTWPDEVQKWDDFKHMKVSVIKGSAKQRQQAADCGADIYTTNFEQLTWLVENWKTAWPYKTVVVDESTRLKGFRTHSGTLRAKALSKVAHRFVKRFIELTGTPAPNGLADLWGQLWFIDKGERLGKSYSEFLNRYFYCVSFGGGNKSWREWRPFDGSEKKIKEKLSDCSITVNAEDYFDLSSNIENVIEVPLPDAAMKMYKKFGRELWFELENGTEITAVNAGVKTGKLLQIASGAVYTDETAWEQVHTAKIEALRSVMEEAGGAPVLCAYSYKHEVERIKKAFPQAKLLDKNPQTIRDWNAGKIPLLLAHPASCGHGLNLQDGGNILVFFSCTWNLEHHDQIVERIGAVRQAQSGHKRPTFIHYLLAKGTVDMAVKERLTTKRSVQDILLGRKNLVTGEN